MRCSQDREVMVADAVSITEDIVSLTPLEIVENMLHDEQDPALRQVLNMMQIHMESGIPIEDLAKAQDAFNDSLRMSSLLRQLKQINEGDDDD